MSAPLVQVRGLALRFDVSAPRLARWLTRQPRLYLQAVAGLDFAIERGRTLALVGESGCGKSTVARLVTGLLTPDQGEVCIDGLPLHSSLQSSQGRLLRRRVQMVFQDPYASLNPRWRVRDIVAEPLRELGLAADDKQQRARVDELLSAVGLSADDGLKYPHQFSGGQRQRIGIARALASQPEFLVCDEPTSALDVSVQAQVLNLMKDLQQARQLTYLFISHNLAVVHHMADEVAVMYLGRVVEMAPRAELFAAPRHPYTRMLLDAIPGARGQGPGRVPPQGEVPSPVAMPSGCAFHPRCPLAQAQCRVEQPPMQALQAGRRVACHAVAQGRC